MRKILTLLFLSICLLSCHHHHDDKEENTELTLLVLHPYASNLTTRPDFLPADEKEIKSAIKTYGTGKNRIFLFAAPNREQAYLIELSKGANEIICDTIESYSTSELDYTTKEGLVQLFSKLQMYSPSDNYAMVIGSHGNGWIPAEYTTSIRRSYGDSSQKETNYTTLGEALEESGILLKYLLLDNCNSQNIETAYDLRNCTEEIVASTCEIMGEGMPYQRIWQGLMTGNTKLICDEFLSYYARENGTLSVVNCQKIDELVPIVCKINSMGYEFDEERRGELQHFGGVNRLTRSKEKQFFDYGSFMSIYCKDAKLLDDFQKKLNEIVVYNVYTEQFFWYTGPSEQTRIQTSSGITTSEPAENELIQSYLKKTAWYKITHPEEEGQQSQ